MNEWIEVAALSAFDKSDRKTIKNAVVFKTEDGFHACENRCPHMGYPMNKGTIRDGILTCAWHNWQFDIDTGGCYRGACDDLQTYPVKVEDDKVWIQLFEPYEHFAMQANRLIEGMRASDTYLQAKAVSMMFKTGGKIADVAAVALDQAFRHSEMNHRSVQAVYEFQAICDSAELAKLFDQRSAIGALVQGIRIAAGPSGDRMTIISLPDDIILEEKMKRLLERFTLESSPLGIERILLNVFEQYGQTAAEAFMLELATEPYFVNRRQELVCLSALIYYGKELDLVRYKPALYAWTLSARRQEADLDGKDAIHWLTTNKEAISNDKFLANDKEVSVDEIQNVISGNVLLESFVGLHKLLEDGIAFECLLNAFSTIAARRFSRLPVNNGGMWNSATENIRYANSLRRAAAEYDATYKFKALFHMAFSFFESRWIKFSGPWKGEENAVGEWSAFENCFNEGKPKEASAIAIALIAKADDESWRADFTKVLLQEDCSSLQLNTLLAALNEMRGLDEWQHYISGVVTYFCDQKLG